MTDTPAARDQQMLGDIAERAYALACELSDQAMAAETPEATGKIAGDFHRVARTLSQTLTLKTRMAREAERDNAFGLEPLDAHIVRLCRDLGLSEVAARDWRGLPDPDEDGPDADAPPRILKGTEAPHRTIRLIRRQRLQDIEPRISRIARIASSDPERFSPSGSHPCNP